MDEVSVQLLGRYRDGDGAAATEIFERYVRRLIGLARKHMSSRLEQRVDAEDVVQSVFRSFFHRAGQGEYELEQTGDLWRLLAMITVNKVRKKARFHGQQKRNAQLEVGMNASADSEAPGPELFVDHPGVTEAIEALDELTHVMEELDERQRTVLELKLQGLELADIATQVRRSERTVRRALDAARELLEQRLLASHAPE